MSLASFLGVSLLHLERISAFDEAENALDVLLGRFLHGVLRGINSNDL